MATTARNVDDIIIKDTHRGLLYEDGVLTKVLEAGRYSIRATRKSFLSRPTELEALRDLSKTANARIYVSFDQLARAEANGKDHEDA